MIATRNWLLYGVSPRLAQVRERLYKVPVYARVAREERRRHRDDENVRNDTLGFGLVAPAPIQSATLLVAAPHLAPGDPDRQLERNACPRRR